MGVLRFLTAGESHGPAELVVVEGLPAGLPVAAERVDRHLDRRQQGYGRGGRMAIEKDRAQILSGVRHGLTLGSPVTILVANRDWENWRGVMAPQEVAPEEGDLREVTAPRPGHADLAGGMKYGARDLRDILERASARETTARVAAGALFQALLELAGIGVLGLVRGIGGISASVPEQLGEGDRERIEASPFRCPDPAMEEVFRARVDEARGAGDTLGGIVEVRAEGVLPGLGSHVHWDRRLDTRLAAAVMSIPGIKGVEIGEGFAAAALSGTACHDEIVPDPGSPWKLRRTSNRAGGIEGGISNGETVVVRAAMKPIPTTGKPLATVDLRTGKQVEAHRERSDVMAVPAAAVVAEAMTAFVLAQACLEKFGGDTAEDFRDAVTAYRSRLAGD